MKKIFYYCQIVSLLTLIGCVSTTPAIPGTGTLWGYLTLKPRQGVKPGTQDTSGYADRRYRHVEFVNYKNPEFAVIYLDGPPSPTGSANVVLKETRYGPSFNSKHKAVGLKGTIVLKNLDQKTHIFSCPKGKFLQPLASGEEATISVNSSGEYTIFILDNPELESTVFVSPGPFAVVTENRRWELPNQIPGVWTLRTWHPRFPALSRKIDIRKNTVQQIDLEIGVGTLTGELKGGS